MGLFSSTPSHANPPPSSDGAFIAPGRQKRARCYEARDRFFACLEQNGIIDSIKDKEQADKACSSEDRGMGMECAASWVTYFKQQRVVEHKKKMVLEQMDKEGAQNIGDNLPANLPRRKPSSS